MAKFYGEIGYGQTQEQPAGSGKFVDVITEYQYYGDVITNGRQFDRGEKVNNDISVSNALSVVADEFAMLNFSYIRYVKWSGGVWSVNSVEVKPPRLILHLGGVYNGPTV